MILICLILLLAPAADAAIGNKGLIVNHGEEIILQKGQKKWLFVQDGRTKWPVIKGLSFFSDNTVVFTVGLHSGVIRGNSLGTAHLTVVNSKGRCGYVTVKVVAAKKIGGHWIIILSVSVVFIFYKLRKY
ncbi:MAG: hypothetical protein IJ043_02595 [Clostridia bacterium]|nr:hypothetical protein [Clostridia bacterium]